MASATSVATGAPGSPTTVMVDGRADWTAFAEADHRGGSRPLLHRRRQVGRVRLDRAPASSTTTPSASRPAQRPSRKPSATGPSSWTAKPSSNGDGSSAPPRVRTQDERKRQWPHQAHDERRPIPASLGKVLCGDDDDCPPRSHGLKTYRRPTSEQGSEVPSGPSHRWSQGLRAFEKPGPLTLHFAPDRANDVGWDSFHARRLTMESNDEQRTAAIGGFGRSASSNNMR